MLQKIKIYHLILIFVLLWNILIISPILTQSYIPTISEIVYSSLHHICHQYESRSIFLFGTKMAVCSRCWGIYFGFLIGTIAFPFLKKHLIYSKWYILCIAVVPILTDIFLDLSNIHESIIITKILSGFFFGILAAPLLVGTIDEAINELLNNIKRRNLCTKNQTNSSRLYTVE